MASGWLGSFLVDFETVLTVFLLAKIANYLLVSKFEGEIQIKCTIQPVEKEGHLVLFL